MQTVILELAKQLANLTAKGTVSGIQTKISSMKNESNIDTLKKDYNELIDQLISERAEAIRIARSYKDELEKVEISDEDIVHLHNTIEKILDILKETIVVENNDNSQEIMNQISAFEQIKNLISVDTLKTMQLLGFNFKIAIGEPLTNMLKNFINSKSPASTQYEVFEKFITPEMVEILKSETAYNNLKNMMAGNDTIEN
ncbi:MULTISPECIES: hypothetical protein [Lactobacillus]|uniref:hypothetical protein n=1 Tax=Lactobacillus TaxID=1578 RepID=UPI001433B18C|nr:MULTISPECIES: hypothetical protein [Lactobacillus]GFI20566.1 hypothetical protein IMSAGC010_01123 [Lactobacillus johnsonii]